MCSEPARMPAKYYIYAGGRWCEVDTRHGRVSGWRQRARFCFLRGGRLEFARTWRVLRALRAHATGVGGVGAVRDAAPLQRRRPHRCDLNANELSQKPPPTLPASTPIAASPRKRRRSATEEAVSRAKRPRRIEKDASQGSGVKVRGKEEEQIVQSLLESNSSEDDRKNQLQQKIKTKIRIRSKEQEELVKSLLESSSEDGSNNNVNKQSTKFKGKGKSQVVQKNQSQQKKEKKIKHVLLSSPLSHGCKSPEKKSSQKNVKVRGKEEENCVQSLLQSSSSEDTDNERAKPRAKPRSKSKKVSDESDSSSDRSVENRREAKCKELVIGDDDVALLRRFLERGADGTDLERFDRDLEYKTSVFYKLNPLVVLNRCAPLERLLLQRLSLREFARQLGLRSVADVTPEKRYRTRRARHVTSDTETDERSVAKPKKRQLWNRHKEIFNSRSSRSSDVRERQPIPRPPTDGNDSDTEVKRHIKRYLERRAGNRVKPEKEKETVTKKANDDNDSVVISDSDTTTDQSADDNQGKSGNKDDSVVVSDETDSDKDESVKSTRRTRANVARNDESESVIVSDQSDSTDERKSIRRMRSASARVAKNDENVSVIISDESNSTNERRPVRRTRSQGPEKGALREHNKSVVVRDGTNSNADDNRGRNRTQPKAPENDRMHRKLVVSDETSSTDENQGRNRRTRSRGPDRALKEQNRSVNNVDMTKVDTKKTNKKANMEVERSTERTTRSSMKGIDNVIKEKKKKDLNPASSKAENEDNPKPARKEVKGSKIAEIAPTVRTQDKSVMSDSDKDFSKLSPKKSKLVQQQMSVGRVRSVKGRFVKTNDKSKTNNIEDNKINGKLRTEEVTNEKDKQAEKSKANERHRGRERDEKHRDPDKNETGNDNIKEISAKTSAVVRNMLMKPIKTKKSSVANGREYTSLEDHAIVAWLSGGGRARLVNGNAVWRELQAEYPRLTSQSRSWHSLRNRYLRYILPSLGSLALPPAQVSRLRAAASVGTIKNRSEGRRNSIFTEPRVRSAATVGRARVRIDSDGYDERERTPPSPRRTRRSSSQTSQTAPPTPTKRVRSRSETAPTPTKRVRSPSKTAPTPTKRIRAPSKTAPSPTKRNLSPSKIAPSVKRVPSPSKNTPSSAKPVPSPSAKRVPSPSKTAPSKLVPSPSKTAPTPTHTSRPRERTSTPIPQKKKRIHHL